MGFMDEDNANHHYFYIFYDIKSKLFYINIDIVRDSWLFIDKVITLADREKVVLSFSNEHRDLPSGGRICEWDVIQIEKKIIKQLVNANEVPCRFVGSDCYHEIKDFSKIEERWKSFYNLELLKYRWINTSHYYCSLG